MEDGFYLSTYIHIDELSNLMNVCLRHDQNLSLWRVKGNKVELLRYWELERFSGRKQYKRCFFNSQEAIDVINDLLKPFDITYNDLVEVWGTPQLESINGSNLQNDYPDFAFHTISHLFSAILMDTNIFNDSTVIGLSIDAGPDYIFKPDKESWYFYSGCVVRNGVLEDVFPVYSPGLIWEFMRQYYGIREGSLMALATSSNSKIYDQKESDIIKVCGNMSDLSALYDYVSTLINRVNNLTEEDVGTLFNGFDPRFSIEDNRISMVMKEIQNMSIKIVEYNIDKIVRDYDIDPTQAYIAMAGGSVLNCPTNSHIMQKYKFKGFMAPPCVSDTGVSLGIALYAFYKKMNTFEFNLQDAFYGWEDTNLDDAVSSEQYASFIKSVSEVGYSQMVDDIMEEPIIWFNGAAEIGPRALGHRSILGDPGVEGAKDRLNIIKQRQWWRPVAPIVLEEDVSEWFDDSYASPYMLHIFKIKEDKLNRVPAIAHLDATARVQTLNEQTDKFLYELVKEFKHKTGVPILCNTSLNDRGEPIINSIKEAFNFALRKNIKVAYINKMRVEFQRHEEYPENEPLARTFMVRNFSDDEKKELLLKLNPYNLSDYVLAQYLSSPHLYNNLSLDKKEDVKVIKRYIEVKRDRIMLAISNNLGVSEDDMNKWKEERIKVGRSVW